MFKNVSGQKFRFYCFDATTGLPKTGDAANLTAYVSKDYGAVTAVTDTSATEEDATNAKGFYLFDASQSETNADNINPTCKSSTSNVVCHYVGARDTQPANATALSIDSNGRVDVIKVAGTTQTARDIGASVLLSSGTGTGQISLSSGAVTVGTNNDKTGYSLTQSFPSNFASLAITAGGIVSADLQTIRTQTVTAAGGVTFPAATLASTTNITAGTVTTATNVTTVNGLAAGVVTAASIAADAITAAKIADGAIDRATFAADTGLQSVRSGTAQAGASASITLDASASAATDFYKGLCVYLTGGTGAGQARLVTAYNGTTKVATVAPAWATSPDNTSTFAVQDWAGVDVELWGASAPNALISGRVDANTQATASALAFNLTGSITGSLSGAVGSVTAGVTVTTNNDKTGYSLTQAFPSNFAALGINASGHVSRVTLTDTVTTYTGNTPQTGDAYALIGAAGSGLTSLAPAATALSTATWTNTLAANLGTTNTTVAANLDAAVTSRMATYTQPAGFLAATFPAVVASTTNITSASGVALSAGGVTAVKSAIVTNTLTVSAGGAAEANVLSVRDSIVPVTAGENFVTFYTNGDSTSSAILDNVSAILEDTGTTIPAQIAALNNVSAADVWGYATRTLTSGSGLTVDANVTQWSGQPVLWNVEGVPVVDVGYWQSLAPDGLNSGLVRADVFAVEAGTIGTASFATGATVPRVTLTDTVTTYTGNTPQTGDSFARIGATGSGLTSLAPASTALSTAVWTNTLAADVAAANATVTSIYGDTQTLTSRIGRDLAITAGGAVTVALVATDAIDADSFTSAAITAVAVAAAGQVTTDHGAGSYVRNTEPPAASAVAAAVWDLATAGHTAAGSFGAAMAAAGTAGDPWVTSLPGSYAAGTAGYLLGTQILQTGDSFARLGEPAHGTIAGDIAAIDTGGGADFDTPILAVTPDSRLVDSDGNQVTSVTVAQALAALFVNLLGDRDGIGSRTITAALPGTTACSVTATRVSRSVIEATITVPAAG